MLYFYDLIIMEDCNIEECSSSALGDYYHQPDGVQKDSDLAKFALAGSYHFKVEEIEVFMVK